MPIRVSFLDKRGLSSSTLANSKTKGCDLKNRVVTAITFEEGPHVFYNHSCIDGLPVSDSSYSEVTHCITGWLVDFFHVLEKHCNFELRVKALKKNIPFGDVVKEKDGGYHTTGYFDEIQHFDCILAATLITEDRSKIVNYLYPLLETKTAIFISKDKLSQQFDWWMYFEVFSPKDWAIILSVAILPTILSVIHKKLALNEKPTFLDVGSLYVASLGVHFGGDFLDKRNRVLVLICHLPYGILIWIYYQATLTSKLTERAYDYPFETLGELSSTNYKLLTDSNTSFGANNFIHAIQNTPQEKVYQNNMGEDSFIGKTEAANKMFAEKSTAWYFYELEAAYHLAMQNKFCKALIPWKSDTKLLYSVGFNKNFTYLDDINMVAMRMKQSGMIQKFFFQHDIVPENCEEKEKEELGTESAIILRLGLGKEKMLPLFAFLFGAMVISFLYMVAVEFAFKYYEQTGTSVTIEETLGEMDRVLTPRGNPERRFSSAPTHFLERRSD